MPTDRRALGRRLYQIAGHLTDQEIAAGLRIDIEKARRCREAVAAGRALPIQRTLVVERFLEGFA